MDLYISIYPTNADLARGYAKRSRVGFYYKPAVGGNILRRASDFGIILYNGNGFTQGYAHFLVFIAKRSKTVDNEFAIQRLELVYNIGNNLFDIESLVCFYIK